MKQLDYTILTRRVNSMRESSGEEMGVPGWLWLCVLLLLGAVCGIAGSSCRFMETLVSQTVYKEVEEINRNPQLLPNLTLGYALADTCLTEGTTLGAALRLVTGKDRVVTGSRLATLPRAHCLGDRQKYPTFFRTVPNDSFQARAMADMLRLFGWTWVGVVAGDEAYGRSGIQHLLKELQNSEVCVAFSEVIPKVNLEKSIPRIVEKLRHSTAKVIVAFAISSDMEALLTEVVRQNITDKQWIASESWIASSLISIPENLPSLKGTIGFALRKANIQGLRSFLTGFQPKDLPSDPFVQEFWELMFGCYFEDGPSPSPSARPQCTGSESLDDVENIYTDVSEPRLTYSVYKSVYAIAYAIHNMLSCQPGDGPFEKGGCPDVTNLQPWQILHYLSTVNFTTPVGEATHYDENGEPPAAYDLINWQVGAQGKVEFVKVGQFDTVDGSHSEFDMDVKKVFWGGGQNEVPVSLCSMPCPPGTWKAVQKGKPICCFDCLLCAEGEISNTTGENVKKTLINLFSQVSPDIADQLATLWTWPIGWVPDSPEMHVPAAA
ncbi:hypothetical protein SKAU_G00078410 [Synaphobranchus kaupii]|uniref:Uncharacterized protein n=1 Tax=Synaphobranchus kaupii TaxID=118154 RepID=A0A9Q1FV62_SYNKA|nr:hypothetical protein SKAU_G00078410 [Synaphobranchus kaupii]